LRVTQGFFGNMSRFDILNGQFTRKCKSCHYYVNPNLYDFVSSGKHKDDILKNLSALCLYSEVNGV